MDSKSGRAMMLSGCKQWWPGTESNRRRQPFQSGAVLNIQQLAGHGRLRKSFEVRASHLYYGLHCGLQDRHESFCEAKPPLHGLNSTVSKAIYSDPTTTYATAGNRLNAQWGRFWKIWAPNN